MRASLKATALLSSGSFVGILAGLVSAKALAVMIGPAGVGMNALLFGIVTLVSLLAGVGLSTGLVRLGAEAAAAEDETALAALYRAAWWCFWLVGGGGFALVAWASEPIARVMLGDPLWADAVVLMGLAALFNLAAGIQTAMINMRHRVAALARLSVVTVLATTTATVTGVAIAGVGGLPGGILAGGALNWLVSRLALLREVPGPTAACTASEALAACRRLVAFGAPFTASQAVGTGLAYVLPFMALHALGAPAVGIYRAATAILERQVGLLTNAFVYDYFPRLAAEREPAQLAAIVNQQLRAVLLIGTPAVLGLLAVAPWLLPLLYTEAFQPGVKLLEWLLLGSLFRLPGWTLGTAVMTHCDSRTFFKLELAGGLAQLGLGGLGLALAGLTGLGVAYALATAAYAVVADAMLRHRHGFATTPANRRLLTLACLAAATLQALSAPLVIELAVALAAAAYCFRLLRREWRHERVGRPPHVQPA